MNHLQKVPVLNALLDISNEHQKIIIIHFILVTALNAPVKIMVMKTASNAHQVAETNMTVSLYAQKVLKAILLIVIINVHHATIYFPHVLETKKTVVIHAEKVFMKIA